MSETIVAEISKNWRDGRSVSADQRTIAMIFENVIAKNAARGYALRSWKMTALICPSKPGWKSDVDEHVITETIVAVFRLTLWRRLRRMGL